MKRLSVIRLSVIVLAVMLAMNSMINFASIRAQVDTASRPDSSGRSQKGFSAEQERALRELAPKLSRFDVDDNGVPSWLMGDLGPAVGDPHNGAIEAMRRLGPAFRMTADDGFDVRKATSDDEGQMHVRLQQRYRGLLVVGSELIVHLEGNKVVGVNGRFTPDINVGIPRN